MGKSVPDMELDFFEEFDDQAHEIQGQSDDEQEHETSLAETKAFWESQHRLLQEALSRRSSTETRIQRDTEEAMRIMETFGSVCSTCSNVCRGNCLLRNIADRLRHAGYNSAVCKSKWRRSPEIPSGEHSYIDVVVEPKSRKEGATRSRIVIEPNFRAEFEMARANAEYNGLVSNLPEIFVGKPERLRGLIRVVCGATKRCMKDNKMHMAPWRKNKYMQSKWLGTCERAMPSVSFPTGVSEKPPSRPRASMQTFDLHCTAVAVL